MVDDAVDATANETTLTRAVEIPNVQVQKGDIYCVQRENNAAHGVLQQAQQSHVTESLGENGDHCSCVESETLESKTQVQVLDNAASVRTSCRSRTETEIDPDVNPELV